MAAKKKASAKRPAKKVAAKRPAGKAVKKTAKKASAKKATVKRSAAKKPTTKKAATKKAATKKVAKKSTAKSIKRPVKKVSKSVSAPTSATVVVPQTTARAVNSNPTSAVSAPVAAKPASPASAPAKKSSSNVLFLVIAGVVLLAIFALTNSSNDEDATPKPTASESVSEEPSAEPSESSSEEPALSAYEAPQSFVAIANGDQGVTLRWKAPTAVEGLTGYVVSVSYNAVDFTEVATVGADQLSYEIAKVGDEGGTQFLLQSVYSDGTKVDAQKFSLKGKFE